MRAKQFIPEAAIGTHPKRPARPGSRPERGHEATPRYTTNEMDKSQKGPPGWNISDDEPGGKEQYGKPAKSKGVAKDALKSLNKEMGKAHKKVKEGADERKQNALWAQITQHEKAAKATKNDIKKQHHMKMASELRGQLKTSDEESLEEYGDTAKGQKMLSKVQKRAVSRMIDAADRGNAKGAKKNQETANRAWDRMTDTDLEEAGSDAMANAAKRLTDPNDGKVAKLRAAGDKRREEHLKSRDIAKKNEAIEAMEAELAEAKAPRALCKSSTPDEDLGASQLASCKSQGLRARDGEKSHKLGKSSKSRVKVGGKRIKGSKYGGPLPDWS